MYYLRSRPAVDAVQFTVDKNALKPTSTCENRPASASIKEEKENPPKASASRYITDEEDSEGCLMCSG